jgi:hypothetical protein
MDIRGIYKYNKSEGLAKMTHILTMDSEVQHAAGTQNEEVLPVGPEIYDEDIREHR